MVPDMNYEKKMSYKKRGFSCIHKQLIFHTSKWVKYIYANAFFLHIMHFRLCYEVNEKISAGTE
jgi:hypothetical protein